MPSNRRRAIRPLNLEQPQLSSFHFYQYQLILYICQNKQLAILTTNSSAPLDRLYVTT